MTLGGLALAVVFRVDDATVEIENHKNRKISRRQGKTFSHLTGRNKSRSRFVSTLPSYCFCSHVFSYWRGPLLIVPLAEQSVFRDAPFLICFCVNGWCPTHGAFPAIGP